MQQNVTKEIQDYAWLGGKRNPLGIEQVIKVRPYYQNALHNLSKKMKHMEFSRILKYNTPRPEDLT